MIAWRDLYKFRWCQARTRPWPRPTGVWWDNPATLEERRDSRSMTRKKSKVSTDGNPFTEKGWEREGGREREREKGERPHLFLTTLFSRGNWSELVSGKRRNCRHLERSNLLPTRGFDLWLVPTLHVTLWPGAGTINQDPSARWPISLSCHTWYLQKQPVHKHSVPYVHCTQGLKSVTISFVSHFA